MHYNSAITIQPSVSSESEIHLRISIRRSEDAIHEYAAVRTPGVVQPEAKRSLQTPRELIARRGPLAGGCPYDGTERRSSSALNAAMMISRVFRLCITDTGCPPPLRRRVPFSTISGG